MATIGFVGMLDYSNRYVIGFHRKKVFNYARL